MNDTEFIAQSEAIFNRIDHVIEEAGLDVDVSQQGNVLELDFDNGEKIIVNRHEAQHELWIAAKSGGYHFSWQDGEWRSTRDQSDFFSTLTEAVRVVTGETVDFQE